MDLPVTAFQVRRDRGENSVRHACKACLNKWRAIRRVSASVEEKARALKLAREWKRKHPVEVNAKRKAWDAAHPDSVAVHNRKASAKWRAANAELATQRVIESKRKRADYYREQTRLWALANPGKCRAKYKKYMAAKLGAFPAWANEFFIEEAYDLAQLRTRMLGYPWDVDHIVPLQSNRVCGLHVHENLAVIPATENRSKGNRHWPDDWRQAA